MVRKYGKCAMCGAQETSENGVRVWNKLLADNKPLCYQKEGEKSCTAKVREAVSKWIENRGQQELSDFVGE